MYESKAERVLLMNTWRKACEPQQQKLHFILKDYSSKINAKHITSDLISKEKYRVTCEPESNCRPNLVAL